LGEQSDISFAEAIRKIRESKNISARALSERCGVSAAYISKVESGRSVPSARTFSRILEELDCNIYEISYLFGILLKEEKIGKYESQS
jgi:transcriptional regulator with XRE-family HTH domain